MIPFSRSFAVTTTVLVLICFSNAQCSSFDPSQNTEAKQVKGIPIRVSLGVHCPFLAGAADCPIYTNGTLLIQPSVDVSDYGLIDVMNGTWLLTTVSSSLDHNLSALTASIVPRKFWSTPGSDGYVAFEPNLLCWQGRFAHCANATRNFEGRAAKACVAQMTMGSNGALNGTYEVKYTNQSVSDVPPQSPPDQKTSLPTYVGIASAVSTSAVSTSAASTKLPAHVGILSSMVILLWAIC